MQNNINKIRLNELGDELISIIKQRTNIFKKIKVIVPSNKTSDWFKAYWIKNQNDVLMNVEFIPIYNALLSFIDHEGDYSLIKREELRTLIIKFLVEREIDLPENIKDYIYIDDRIDQIKIYDLSNKLSSLYFDYEKDQVMFSGWQKELYDKVFKKALEHNLSSVSYLYNENKQVKKLTDPIYFFGFIGFDNLQSKIINDLSINSNVTLMMLELNEGYQNKCDLIAAPSKLREIETIHSKICTLLLEDENSYDDFLVLAPDVSIYEDVIPRVFNQDNSEFPNIPYVINDRKRIETNVANALNILIEIANKKFFTRLDFFNLISNKTIQLVRDISADDVDNWSRYLVNINAYRNNSERDDWEYARTRILLSKISNINDVDNNIIEINNKKYLPFTTIDFDDDSIVKFISVIDDLKSWLKITASVEFINSENVLVFKNELDKWFSIKDVNGSETNGYYRNIVKNLDFWNSISLTNNLVPRNTLFYSLLDAANAVKFKSSDYFVKGITFADFEINAILSCKYVFFLGASSANFPLPVVKSELDVRTYDINNKEQIKKAFFIQYQNAFAFSISYINKNLKTDEDFYPSTFIINLKEKNTINEINIDIDETRNWNELFTKKSYVNKKYFYNLLNNKKEDPSLSIPANKAELPKKIRIKELSDYLEEPLKNKAKYLFGYDDNLEEEIQKEYEPFELNNLVKSNLFRKICVYALEHKLDSLTSNDFINIKERFNLEYKLPNIHEYLNEISFQEVVSKCEEFINNIHKKVGNNFELYRLEDTVLKTPINEIILTCNQEMCRSINGNCRTYFQIKSTKNSIKIYEYLYSYIFSLIDIMNEEENEYEIILDRGMEKSFIITPSEAKELLENIYLAKIDYKDNAYVPIDKYDKFKNYTFNKMLSDLNYDDNSPWKFFSQRKLFDYDTDLGYTIENFSIKFKEHYNKHIKLIKFLKPIVDSESEEGEDNGK